MFAPSTPKGLGSTVRTRIGWIKGYSEVDRDEGLSSWITSALPSIRKLSRDGSNRNAEKSNKND